jgi:phytoene dehydrogenase-like protein
MNINIIGAGISGLIAAKVLEENGYNTTIIEATNRPGGRVKTDIVDGFQLDRGFQVLLSEYPAAKKHLDYNELELQNFGSGAVIFTNGRQKTIGDPLRDLSLLFPTIFSGIGNLVDKLKILKLNNKLKSKNINDIFETPEKTTKQYLQDFGFSEDIISKFFCPFFTGIFLETELETSSRMFEFVFKMFAEGTALMPKQGIEAIPRQIASNLKSTIFKYNKKVNAVSENTITLESGEEIKSDYTIVTGDIESIIKDKKVKPVTWKSCTNIYFTCSKKLHSKPLIGLVANKNSLVNNVFYHNSLQTGQKGKGELLSVTIVKKHKLSNKALISAVKDELKTLCGISDLTYLKMYNIPKALPHLTNLSYTKVPKTTHLDKAIFIAGDAQINGSLNAAMLSGELAAKGVLAEINKTNNC